MFATQGSEMLELRTRLGPFCGYEKNQRNACTVAITMRTSSALSMLSSVLMTEEQAAFYPADKPC